MFPKKDIISMRKVNMTLRILHSMMRTSLYFYIYMGCALPPTLHFKSYQAVLYISCPVLPH